VRLHTYVRIHWPSAKLLRSFDFESLPLLRAENTLDYRNHRCTMLWPEKVGDGVLQGDVKRRIDPLAAAWRRGPSQTSAIMITPLAVAVTIVPHRTILPCVSPHSVKHKYSWVVLVPFLRHFDSASREQERIAMTYAGQSHSSPPSAESAAQTLHHVNEKVINTFSPVGSSTARHSRGKYLGRCAGVADGMCDAVVVPLVSLASTVPIRINIDAGQVDAYDVWQLPVFPGRLINLHLSR
jgi:hypothetical protein